VFEFFIAARLADLVVSLRAINSRETGQKPRTNTLMHVGGDYHNIVGGDITSKQNLEYNLRYGVKQELLKSESHCLEIESCLVCLLQEVYPEISREKSAGISSGLEQHPHRLECSRESTNAELQ
jgi:hypothetical protein